MVNTPFYVTLLVAALAAPATSICYYPDGSNAPNDTPCTEETTESSCCGQGYACLGIESQYFLCQATGSEINKTDSTSLVRGSCTDQSWRSGNCPSVCVNQEAPAQDNTAGGEGVEQCPGSKNTFFCVDFAQDSVNCSTEQNVILFERESDKIA